jgi:hypothetical protein
MVTTIKAVGITPPLVVAPETDGGNGYIIDAGQPHCASAGSRSQPGRNCGPANLPCLLGRIGPVKPPVLLPVLVVRIEGQTGMGRNRFGGQGRNRYCQARNSQPLQRTGLATP